MHVVVVDLLAAAAVAALVVASVVSSVVAVVSPGHLWGRSGHVLGGVDGGGGPGPGVDVVPLLGGGRGGAAVAAPPTGLVIDRVGGGHNSQGGHGDKDNGEGFHFAGQVECVVQQPRGQAFYTTPSKVYGDR